MSRNLCTVQSLALALSVSLLPVGLAAPAHAQAPYPPEGQRNVEFYVQHPEMRSRVNRACLNDPGHYRNNPDCFNADQANLESEARKAQASHAGNVGNPLSPAYWTARPHDRAFKLGYCNRMTPEHQVLADCGPAQQSFAMEQRGTVAR